MIRQSFQPLLARAELPRIRFHDLRHSTATLLFTLGVHPKIVQEFLGHSQIFVMLDSYSHILPILQGEAMQQLNDALFNIIVLFIVITISSIARGPTQSYTKQEIFYGCPFFRIPRIWGEHRCPNNKERKV
jgi:hypothetical protein